MEKNKSIEYQQGFQDGQKNTLVTIAVKMLSKDLDKELIKEISGLNDEQLFIVEETLTHNQHSVDKIVEDYQTNHNTK